MLSHLFQKIFSILMTLLLSIGLGFLGCMGASRFFEAVSGGLFSRWTSIGTPPGKAISIQIAASESASGRTVVKTGEGKFYAYKPGLFARWVETTWSSPEKTRLTPNCLPFDNPEQTFLSHAIVDCNGYSSWEW
ncbi:MAG: hypothetical protein A2136_06085 [Chloroflexi bacterium RBG_16_54_11]|nr:MAG: hypothetical protein A2136_06085 [Chloroflexi bacterium RBG_16_54_11]